MAFAIGAVFAALAATVGAVLLRTGAPASDEAVQVAAGEAGLATPRQAEA